MLRAISFATPWRQTAARTCKVYLTCGAHSAGLESTKLDFEWTDEQSEFKTSVIEFARQQLNDDLVERDRDGEFSRDLWQKCAEFGIQGLAMPADYGGRDLDILSTVLAMEGLGYGCRDNGLTLALNAQIWTVQLAILHFGSREQKQRWLPGLCQGAFVGAYAMTEPTAGSDIYAMVATAEAKDSGYLLNGTKSLVTLAPVADLILVFAVTDPNLGRWGISCFVVEADTPGCSVSPVQEKMGLRTVPLGEVTLENCLVSAENRLGAVGAGMAITTNSLEWERSCMLASHVGAMERQLEDCVEYAGQRQQFEQPIGKFQSVSNRLVEMKLRLEAARLLIYRVAWLKKLGRSAAMEAAMAKLYLSEAFVESSMDAIRINGGRGYLSENEVERDLRDAVGGVLYGGTSDIQRAIIARFMGL